MDSFLVHCLLADSPDSNAEEHIKIGNNQHRIVYRGREPGLALETASGERDMREWADELLNDIELSAKLLDASIDSDEHIQALSAQRNKLENAELTPSAQQLQAMRDGNKTFFRLSLEQAQAHRHSFNGGSLKADTEKDYLAMAAQSHLDQASIEAADTVSFAEHLSNYYDQYRNCSCAKA